MGGVASRVNKEERVRVCKERRKLMKQLVRFRGEFADAQLVYLRALRNTGATLRQFTESESLELETTSYGLGLPPSPPPPLPPSPPPPPPLSPDFRKSDNDRKEEIGLAESMEIIEDDASTPPPPLVEHSSSWDIFGSSSPHYQKHDETVEPNDEEKWADTKPEFEEDEQEEETVANVVSMLPKKLQLKESVEVNSSTMRWPYPKGSADTTMVLWKRKRTLESIVKELDEHFLKSSAGLKEIAVLMEIKGGNTFLPQRTNENKRKRCNSAKVFSALSWSRSARALQYSRDAVESSGPSEPCRPGAHCITLRKLYEAEKKLYEEIKEEELTRLEYERKSKLLQKQEAEGDCIKSEKTRFSVENLEADILGLQQSISSTCSSMVKLIDYELYPQLCTLISGLLHIWKMMHECHQVQNFVSQQLNNLTDIHKIDLSTTYHRQAAIQLESEVSCWNNSFSEAIKSQQEYVRTLCRWIQLTDNLVDENRQSLYSSAVCRLCGQWQLALDESPDKEAAEAIKSLLSAVHRICLQQEEEHNLQKKSDKLEKRLQKELHSLADMGRKMELSFTDEDACSDLDPKHPFAIKRDKTEALKKQVEIEKAKYLNEVQVSKNLILDNLKTYLPKVFQSLMAFSSAYVQGIEAISCDTKQAECSDGELQIS
ncbi:protein ALTERED PHOSPHATE STARVATION RESPONSE 1 [Argentina anserina]|uniref:protein ALTERED PHOSPHATE STARVATION RESPONSE 1 n=1 Tax=Argentina anserina TaxID=57926 RepID=UPI0021768892|nr:protein ALTERED PHOSPHATE STARVATION RESPONSE 1 [Potentilla anserina]XP_050367726.1 protein ALTERED PHOSPHATE STARVATION RESPONSE 1 [Potentilla anserina]XP_050367727.1 protein ALTERED PHOSPHATE STARVATION RESPONSE 1 [Potentilla anserina]